MTTTKSRLQELKNQLDKINGVEPEPVIDPLSRLKWTPQAAALAAADLAKGQAKIEAGEWVYKADGLNKHRRGQI
jgi:hypothetical protein